MFAVHPICIQDFICKMSSASPDIWLVEVVDIVNNIVL